MEGEDWLRLPVRGVRRLLGVVAGMTDGSDEYRARVTTAVTKAVFEASLTEIDGNKTAYIRTAEACEALISVIGMLMEGAPSCRTPAGMKKMAEAVGRNALVAMRQARQIRETTGRNILGTGVVVN